MGGDWSWLRRVEGPKRTLEGPFALAFNLTAAAFAAFYLYTSGFGIVSTESNRGIYLAASSILVLVYPPSRRSPAHRPSVLDLLLVLSTIAA